MKIGACTNIENLETAAALGYDYIEIALNWLAGLEDEAYEAIASRVSSFPIPVAKANCFLPGTLKVTGPDVDENTIDAYLEKAFARANRLGISVVVFGSGGARNVPEGWPQARAWQQLAHFLTKTGPVAQKYGVTVVIEPLRREECNIMNLVSEATLMAALVDHPNIQVLGDTHHMLFCHEPWGSLPQAGSMLKHVHVSHTLEDRSNRIYPQPGQITPCEEVIQVLKDMHYEGDISVEASCKDFAKDAAEAVALLRPMINQ